MKKIILILTFLLIGSSQAHALGGDSATDATGDDKVVALIMGGDQWQRGCSGAAIAPRVVLTAAHCTYGEIDGKWSYGRPNDTKVYGELRVDQKFWVSKPGVLVPIGGTKEKVRVIAQFPSQRYERGWMDNERGAGIQGRPPIFDFAVLILESDITSKTYRFATAKEIYDIKENSKDVFILGYGLQTYEEYKDAGKNGNFPNPQKTIAKIVKATLYQRNSPKELNAVENMMIQTKLPPRTYMGGGDSGSPLWAIINEEWVYLGAACCGLGLTAETDQSSKDNAPSWLKEITGGEYHNAFAFPELFEEAYAYLNSKNSLSDLEVIKNDLQDKEKTEQSIITETNSVVTKNEPDPQPVLSEKIQKEIKKVKTFKKFKCKKNNKTITVISKTVNCPKGWKVSK